MSGMNLDYFIQFPKMVILTLIMNTFMTKGDQHCLLHVCPKHHHRSFQQSGCRATLLLRPGNSIVTERALDDQHLGSLDSVVHSKLQVKLQGYGFGGKLHCILSGFVRNRVQRVVLPEGVSSYGVVTTGVPHGSVLGPLLFLPRCMKCRRGLAILSVRLSVRLSVCLSVKRMDCDKTEEQSVQIFIPYKISFILVF